MAAQGSKRVEVAGLEDKRQITATFAACLDGTFSRCESFTKAKPTDHTQGLPTQMALTCTTHQTTGQMKKHVFAIFKIFPYLNQVREAIDAPSQKALLIMDNFTGQTTGAVLELLEEKEIAVVMVPANCTDRFQPLDVSVNNSAKDFLRAKFRTWYAEQVEKQLQAGVEASAVHVAMGMPVMKEAGAKWLTSLYSNLQREKRVIVNGFRNVGIIEELERHRQNPDLLAAPHISTTQDDSDPFDSDTD